MPGIKKLLSQVLSGRADKSIKFKDLQNLLKCIGFECRIKGDHFIYYKTGVCEIINIQPEGNYAKAYQVKQIRNLILKYGMEAK